MRLLLPLVVFISKGHLSPVPPTRKGLARNAVLKSTKMHKMTKIWMDLQLVDISMSPSLLLEPPSALLVIKDEVAVVFHNLHYSRLLQNSVDFVRRTYWSFAAYTFKRLQCRDECEASAKQCYVD